MTSQPAVLLSHMSNWAASSAVFSGGWELMRSDGNQKVLSAPISGTSGINMLLPDHDHSRTRGHQVGSKDSVSQAEPP